MSATLSHQVRSLWLLARAGFRRHSTYRLALAAGLTTNAVFGLLRGSILGAVVASAGGTLGGYDAGQVTAYVWWGQALLGAIGLAGWSELRDRVRSGDVAIDFLRPLSVPLGYLAGDLGRAAVNLLGRGLPMIVLAVLVFRMPLPTDPVTWLLGFVAILVGVVVAFLGTYLLNATCFWVVESRGLQVCYLVASGFLSGLYLPVHWFPEWLLLLARCTPFPSTLQAPLDVLSGRVSGAAAVTTVVIQLSWATTLFVAAQVVTALGRRHLEVQGG
ncbi:MAG TPA: ABC-2 family transporter protein [Dermatophilaceae bacterium]|nr:ABC-2 family transporter protein [Dermatophilaceae bacterium]